MLTFGCDPAGDGVAVGCWGPGEVCPARGAEDFAGTSFALAGECRPARWLPAMASEGPASGAPAGIRSDGAWQLRFVQVLARPCSECCDQIRNMPVAMASAAAPALTAASQGWCTVERSAGRPVTVGGRCCAVRRCPAGLMPDSG